MSSGMQCLVMVSPLTFQRNVLGPSSWSKVKQEISKYKEADRLLCFSSGFLLDLLFEEEYGGSVFL